MVSWVLNRAYAVLAVAPEVAAFSAPSHSADAISMATALINQKVANIPAANESLILNSL